MAPKNKQSVFVQQCHFGIQAHLKEYEKTLRVHGSRVVFHHNSMLSGMPQAKISGHLSYKHEGFPTRQPFCNEDAP